MATLDELRERTQAIIRGPLDTREYLLNANEMLEELSEIAKSPAEPIILKPQDNIEYVILTNDTRLFRREVSTDIVKEVKIAIQTNLSSDFNEEIDMELISVDRLTQGQIVNIKSIDNAIKADNLEIITIIGNTVTLKRTDNTNVPILGVNIEIGTTDNVTFEDDVFNFTYFNLDGSTASTPNNNEILEALKVTKESIELPSDFMQVYKVEGRKDRFKFTFRQRGFGDDVITTVEGSPSYGRYGGGYDNDNHLFFEQERPRKIVLKSGYLGNSNNNNTEITIYYYRALPLYDINTDKDDFSSLDIPFEARYHNLINLYNAMKYYEGLQEESKIGIYMKKYRELREEYKEAVSRRHGDDIIYSQVISSPWR